MNFDSTTVLCVGDVMLDRYVHGRIARISPEAPVPVLKLEESKETLGGAGNAANNVASLGGRAILISLIADDGPGRSIVSLVSANPRVRPAFVNTSLRPTICKTRLIASGQQVVRTDEESSKGLQPSEELDLLAAIDAHIDDANALILSDYGKAVLSQAVIAHAIEGARARGIPVFVDPKTNDFSRYRHATCITPNLKELADASGMPVDDEPGAALAARKVMLDATAAAILVTRSEQGMMLVEADGSFRSVPARAREVFDVSGAGDTVIATMALAHASGLPLVDAMALANAAAGVVVSKSGTATATLAEVLHEFVDQDDSEWAEHSALLSLTQASARVARWKQRGLSVGFTNGCFDILHPGHVALLSKARAECNRLIVALNTDSSVRRLKGPTRPVNDLSTRAEMIAAIRHVDCVVAFDAETPLELIRLFMPDVLIKGGDYQFDTVVGADLVTNAGGRVVLVDLLPGKSTTEIISRLGSRHNAPADAG